MLFGVSRLWFRGVVKGNAKTVYRANNLYAIAMIPAARVVGRVYLDCDYSGSDGGDGGNSRKMGSFRPDRNLSCFTSWQWWIYVRQSVGSQAALCWSFHGALDIHCLRVALVVGDLRKLVAHSPRISVPRSKQPDCAPPRVAAIPCDV